MLDLQTNIYLHQLQSLLDDLHLHFEDYPNNLNIKQ